CPVGPSYFLYWGLARLPRSPFAGSLAGRRGFWPSSLTVPAYVSHTFRVSSALASGLREPPQNPSLLAAYFRRLLARGDFDARTPRVHASSAVYPHYHPTAVG